MFRMVMVMVMFVSIGKITTLSPAHLFTIRGKIKFLKKWLWIGGWKDKLNFKTYDVTTWLPNNCNIHIDNYF